MTYLRKFLGATVCALAIGAGGGTQANAQDAGAAYDWNGLFVGLHTGYGWSDTDVSRDRTRFRRTRNLFSTELEPNGLLGGIQVGYNHQHNDFVFGVIGDIALTGMSDSAAFFRRQGPFAPPVRFETEYEWLATIRGRAGWLINDQTLLYAHGGLAITNMSTDFTLPRGRTFSVSGNDTGWVAGAGIETAVSDRVSLFAEYAHFDFGSGDSVTFGPGGPLGTVTYSADNEPIDTIKIGINFKLWRPGN